jgi:photosystem II oxygen-evolving enhancer protein 2
VQQRLSAAPKGKAARAPVRAAAATSASSSDGTRRQALVGGVAAAALALAPAGPALAISGFSAVKDTRDGYQFYYPVGWQEITVDGQAKVLKDIIEPLESAALNIYPTSRESLAEIGNPDEVAKTLVAKALAIPGSQAKVGFWMPLFTSRYFAVVKTRFNPRNQSQSDTPGSE